MYYPRIDCGGLLRSLGALLSVCTLSCSDPSSSKEGPEGPPSNTGPDGGTDGGTEDGAPALTITDPPSSVAWVPTRRIRIAGSFTRADGPVALTIRVNDIEQPIEGGATSTFDVMVDPPPGIIDVEVRATDVKGRAASKRVRLHVGVEVGAGLGHSGALVEGVATTWGGNGNGALGADGDARATPLPVTLGAAPVTSVAFASGSSRSMALDGSGGLWTWGSSAGKAPALAATIEGAVQITNGGGHALVLARAGGLWAFGANAAGQLGTGTTQPEGEPIVIGSVPKALSACAGSAHSAAVTEDGTVLTWGANDRGQLGHGAADAIPHPVPAPVSLPGSATAVACGRDHSLARLTDGSVWAWGVGSSGQLGHGASGNLGDRAQPTRVSDLSHARHVSAAGNSSWAIDDTGHLWAWGQNSSGQLGVGTTSEKVKPAKVTALTNVIGVAGGGLHAVFRTSDGQTWTSGSNGSLQLGRTTGTSLSPGVVTWP